MRAIFFGALGIASLTFASQETQYDYSNPNVAFPVPTRKLVWGDGMSPHYFNLSISDYKCPVNVLHTTDIHGWISGHSKKVFPEMSWSGGFGDFYSFIIHMRKEADQRGSDLLLVDTGDRRIGHGLTDHILDPTKSVNGQLASLIYKHVDYDLVIPGNHDLENKNVVQFTKDILVRKWGDKYLTSNINRENGEPLGVRFRRWTSPKGKEMLAFGVVTSKTGTKESGLKVVPITDMVQQEWFKEAIKSKVDVFVLLGHVDPQQLDGSGPADNITLVYEAIRREHRFTPIMIFAGHAHKRWCRTFEVESKGESFTRSMLIESGRYFDTVGWMSVKLDNNTTPQDLTFSRRFLDNNIPTYMFHTRIKNETDFHTFNGTRLTKFIKKMENDEALSKVWGELDSDYYLDREDWNEQEEDKSSLFTFYLNAVQATLIDSTKSPNWLFISNWGIMRGDIYRGLFTLSDYYAISPDGGKKHPFFYINVPRHIADQLVLKIQQMENEEKSKRRNTPASRPETFKVTQAESQSYFSLPSRNPVSLTYGWVTEDTCGRDEHDRADDVLHFQIPKVSFDKPKSGLPVYFWRKNYGSDLHADTRVDIIVTNRIGKPDGRVAKALKELGACVECELKSYREDVNQFTLLRDYLQTNFPQKVPSSGKHHA
ncbi:Metallo-dependent phosphatase-like protein [Rhizoctonia solani]|nr:Metallo-dependent phosphatase-like protein [Rhizoctonia solani]